MSSAANRPALTVDSAIEHGLHAESVPADIFSSRINITAKSAGEILRFLAACGMDYSRREGPTTQNWIVRDQDGKYRGSVMTADSVADYALFSGAAS